MNKVALVTFQRGSFGIEYSYKTDIEDLKDGDVVVVQACNTYSIANFTRYSESKEDIEKATKWVVQKVDIEAFENKLFLEE